MAWFLKKIRGRSKPPVQAAAPQRRSQAQGAIVSASLPTGNIAPPPGLSGAQNGGGPPGLSGVRNGGGPPGLSGVQNGGRPPGFASVSTKLAPSGQVSQGEAKKRRVHVFLPGLSAFDDVHTRAALFEMNQPNTSTGTIFVESESAKESARLKIGKVSKRKNFELPEIRVISSEPSRLKKISSGLRSPAQSKVGDILVVKGHGSPKSGDSISTRVVEKDNSLELEEETENIPKGSIVRMKGKFEIRHSSKSIAKSINEIAKMLFAESLDVRLTSCGSAGTVSSAADKRRNSLSESFAGQVSSELDALNAPNGVKVSGFLGDVNSSLPVKHGRSRTFVTKIKQKNRSRESMGESEEFRERLGRSKGFEIEEKEIDDDENELTKEQKIAVSPKFKNFVPGVARRKEFGPELANNEKMKYVRAFTWEPDTYAEDYVEKTQTTTLVASRRRSLARVSVPRRPRAPSGGSLDSDV